MDRKERLRATKSSPDRDDLVLKLLGVPDTLLDAIYRHTPLERAETSRFCDVFSPEAAIQETHSKQQTYKPDSKACGILQRSNGDSYIRDQLSAAVNLPVSVIRSLASATQKVPCKYTYTSTKWIKETEEIKEAGAFCVDGFEDLGHTFCDSSIRTSQVITDLVENLQKKDTFSVIFLLPLNQKYQESQPNKAHQHHWHIIERDMISQSNITKQDAIATVAAIQLMTLGARIVQHKNRPPWIQSNVSTNVVTKDLITRTVLSEHLQVIAHEKDDTVFDIRTVDENKRLNIQPEQTPDRFSAYTSMDIPRLIKRQEKIVTNDECLESDDWYALEDPMQEAKMDDFLAFYNRLYQLLTNSSGILCKIDIELNTKTGKASNQRIICPTYWKEFLGNKSGTSKQGSKDRDDMFQRSNPDGTPRPLQFFPQPDFSHEK